MLYRHFTLSAITAASSLFALLTLSACSNDTKPLPYPMTLKEEGIGKINAGTPFDAAKVGALLPGFDVDSYTSFKEGKPYPILRITRNGHEIMIISPSKDVQLLGSLSVTTPAITTADGYHVGDDYATVFTDTAPSCRSGNAELSDKLLCQAPGSARIHYLFASSGQTPDAQQPLPHSAVEEIIWTP